VAGDRLNRGPVHDMSMDSNPLRDALQMAINQRQAGLDQAWKTLDDNLMSIQQIFGVMDSSGIISGYLAILIARVQLNRLKRQLEGT
jgi:hypothetical protein